MSSAVRLPPELRDFLSLAGPQSLVLRGPPGSGKTTLALAMLEQFSGPRFFVTGRVGGLDLARHYPWLATSDGRIEVVDTVSVDQTPVATVPPGSTPPRIGAPGSNGPRSVDTALPPTLTADWARPDQDAGTPRDLSWLPPTLRTAWGLLASGKPAMVVVDSWEAFAEEFADAVKFAGQPRPDRSQIERVLLRQINRGRSHVALIVERHEQTQLEYLVNGIVELRREEHEGNLERWLSLPKLRGVRIPFTSYPFTLEGARFQCITPIPGDYQLQKVVAESDPAHDASSLWPGSEEFAGAFGRLPVGSATILEVDPGVPESSFESLVFPIMLTVLRKWGRILLALPPSLRAADLWNAFRAAIPEDVLNDQLRVISGGSIVDEDHPLHKLILPLPPSISRPGTTPMPSKVVDFLSERSSQDVPNLIVSSADALRAIAVGVGTEFSPTRPPPIIPRLESGAPLHSILLAATGDPIVETVRNLAAIHVRLRNRLGRTFVYGVRPMTAGYLLTLRSEGRPYDLLPIV